MNGLVFYFEPSRHKPLRPRLSVGEVKGIFLADEVRHLGTGAGGDTWLIRRSGTDLAVKMFTRDDYQLSWVDREIRGLQRGASRHVVRVERVEQVRFSIGNKVIIYFEYIDGAMLDSVIREGHWPTIAEVESFARGVLDGLSVLHANDVVHRDIKPANIALRDAAWDSRVILDLGLARLLDETSITPYPQPVGTPSFMAPEVIRGGRAKRESDLWSLGVILYVLLSRRHPFYGRYADRFDDHEALAAIARGPSPLPISVPARLAALVERLLSPAPSGRGTAASARRSVSLRDP